MNQCPLCRGASESWLEKNGHTLFRCQDCQHRYSLPPNPVSHIQDVYGDKYFSDSSEGYVDYLGEEAIQRASARHYVGKLRPLLPARARVLDVGAACGFFLKEYQDAGWQVIGLEPNASMRAAGEKRFQVSIQDGSLAELSNETTFDLISAIQVISHLVDPVEFVSQANAKLTKGGYFLVETWDRDSLAARMSGSSWHELNPPSVLHWFSRASLRKLVCDAGFELVSSGLPRKRIQLGRAFRMLRHSGGDSKVFRVLSSPLQLVPEQLSVPYLLGDAFWMLFRKREGE